MLKHCHNTSLRGASRRNLDTVSLSSTVTVQSSCGSSESNTSESPDIGTIKRGRLSRLSNGGTIDRISMSSRASSVSSLSESGPKTVLKIYASCLRPDIEYKTLSVATATTARDVIWQLLAKFKMKHRDPKLFYLTMEVALQKTDKDGLSLRTLVLEDDARPAELKSCNPWGECKFSLQMRKGGLIRVYDSVLMQESQYKCLLISDETTVEDVIRILLHCYGLERVERVERYCMYEQCSSQRYQRKLENEDRPLLVQNLWSGSSQFSFILKHNPGNLEDYHWAKCHNLATDKADRHHEPRRGVPPWSPAEPSDSQMLIIETWTDSDKERDIDLGDEDMDTSLSSLESPHNTSLPANSSLFSGSSRCSSELSESPKLSLGFSPMRCSYSSRSVPASVFPVMSLSNSCLSLKSAGRGRLAPVLPPKPASLSTLLAPASNCPNYENYFYI